MEYDLSKDSPEERFRKKNALKEKYKDKGFIENVKSGLKEWWEFQKERSKGGGF